METFGRYQLRRRIGTGGMAEVFVAEAFGAEGFVKDVVIKRILPAFGEDPEFVRMFINEARLAAKLQHANIVQIYDFNHVEGVYYIAMEWVDGLDLRSVIGTAHRRQIPIPLRLAVHVGVETLKGLHHAHTRAEGGQPLGVVHRDISPHNLLVSYAGEVKITDFGIAKAAAVSSATRRGSVKGKLAYMSPEQVDGNPVDARSDLFSLGIVLWELLAGRRLYQAESEGALFGKVRRAEIPPLQPLNPEVPPELETLLRRLLAANVEARFQTAAEVLGEIGALAKIDDGLQVGTYLQRLLPDQAGRDRRGGTEALGGGVAESPHHSVAVAPPDAPTHTVGKAGEIAEQPPSVGGAVWNDKVVVDEPQPSAATPSPTPRRHSARLLVALPVAVACGALSFWIAGAVRTGRTALPGSASLEVQAPAGSSVIVEGQALGHAPVALQGPRGRQLRIEARHGDATIALRTATLGAGRRLLLARPDAGPDRAFPPDAGRGDQQARIDHRPRCAARGPDGARPIEKARRPPPSKQAGQGRLSVIVVPWAKVLIDSKEVGQTPILEHPLSAGPHSVELHNSELGKRDRRQVQIQAGKLEKIRIVWD